mgnify:CR=1 FL=1
MPLIEHMDEDTIDMDLQAVERDAALRTLLETTLEAGEIPEEMVDAAMDALLEREQLGSTGIGNGVAVPHARVEGLDGPAVDVNRADPAGSGVTPPFRPGVPAPPKDVEKRVGLRCFDRPFHTVYLQF